MAQTESIGRDLVNAAMTAPFLEREEEHLLAVRWKDNRDEVALHKLAAAHMRLVLAVAARYRRYGLPLPDLVQEGHVGLLEAAARFDPYREVRFSTYATWWIRASIQDFILRNWSIVRGGTSSGQKALFFNLRRIRARLAHKDGFADQSVLHAAIADAIGVSKADVELMDARLSGPDLSLNAPLGAGESQEDSERVDFLVDDKPLADETVGDVLDTSRRMASLQRALSVLSERELRIVKERRLTEESATLEQLGASLGISKERVRQIETRALEKLREALVIENKGEPLSGF